MRSLLRWAAPSTPLVLLITLISVLPLAIHFVIDVALLYEALPYPAYVKALGATAWLELPGVMIPEMLRLDPYYWSEHSYGKIYWQQFTIFMLGQLLGWTLVVSVVRAIFSFLRRLFVRR